MISSTDDKISQNYILFQLFVNIAIVSRMGPVKPGHVTHACRNEHVVVGRRGNCQQQDMEEIRPLMQMVLHCIDKTRRIRLTREVCTHYVVMK